MFCFQRQPAPLLGADPEEIDPMTVGLDYPIPTPYKPGCMYNSEGVIPTAGPPLPFHLGFNRQDHGETC